MKFETRPASSEDREFAGMLNGAIEGIGARCHAFEQHEMRSGEVQYGLVIEAGPHRLTIHSPVPWHIEGVAGVTAVTDQVRAWIDAAIGAHVWTTEPPDDFRAELH